jgi:hypothetical protein
LVALGALFHAEIARQTRAGVPSLITATARVRIPTWRR